MRSNFWAKFSNAHPESGFPAPLVGALCLAENCIGPEAYRPDDIITMHSGLTCEVDNTDAEGRFVVGDGCSYLAREPRNRSATWSAFACQPLREMVVRAGEMGVSRHNLAAVWVAFSPSGLHSSQDSGDIVVDQGAHDCGDSAEGSAD